LNRANHANAFYEKRTERAFANTVTKFCIEWGELNLRQLGLTNHMNRFSLCAALSLFAACFAQADEKEKGPGPVGAQSEGHFYKVILDSDQELKGKLEDTLKDPMELVVAGDGRVFYAERAGTVKMWVPETKITSVIGAVNVTTNLEDGLLGITLDPKFSQNNWMYLYYALPETGKDARGEKAGTNRLSRFTLVDSKLDMQSERPMLDVATQREQCCHSGGSMTFDSEGNLYLSTGDNTNPFDSDGYSPSDERKGRSPWDAQKSAANSNDLRGKVLRIHPEPSGDYTIPAGNLFPNTRQGGPSRNRSSSTKGAEFLAGRSSTRTMVTGLTRPEIYVMGCRNPFRISVDRKTGYVYWGDVGPDAGNANEKRGPAGHDEVNQARKAGFFGWPYLVADNKPYFAYNFEKKKQGKLFSALKPVNNSPNNTGLRHLPPAQGSFVAYPAGTSTRFPLVNGGGGRTAMAGPIYYFDPNLKSDRKLPQEFDHTLFIYEWSRNWIIAVHLDADDKIAKMERFCPKMSFKRPMDIELGPDGCLYLIEWGTAWGNNVDTQIERIEYRP
jgi:cytochrome c